MKENVEILKNKPDYEDYTLNEVKLSVKELRELGLLKCGGCCKDNNKGCKKEKSCCKSKI